MFRNFCNDNKTIMSNLVRTLHKFSYTDNSFLKFGGSKIL